MPWVMSWAERAKASLSVREMSGSGDGEEFRVVAGGTFAPGCFLARMFG